MAIERLRAPSFAFGAALAVALALGLTAAGCRSNRGVFNCQCGGDDDPACSASEVCDGCACLVRCAGNADCLGDAPNCDPDAGLCGAACTDASGCPAAAPVCDPASGLCQGACPATACPTSRPNCDPTTGACGGPCAQSGCPDPALPNCEPASGRCLAPCTDAAGCYAAAPNCDPGAGLCYGPCAGDSGCPLAAEPVCDPASGRCQGSCPATPCPAAVPSCVEATGRCEGPCAANPDCSEPGEPNCDPSTGVCGPPCAASADCPAAFPNCEAATGLCFAPCVAHPDCRDPALPNCDDAAGLCGAACGDDADCPGEICEAGLCQAWICNDDSGCAPPLTVCDTHRCLPGCAAHADCDPADRCRLTGPSPNRCEPRDCLADAACSPPATVCDTDGGADAVGGGFCVGGCATFDDCPAGYDCDVPAGACRAIDFGDVGTACQAAGDCGNCRSEHGVTDAAGVERCSSFCCTEHDCPAGWGCRPVSDGITGDSHCQGACTFDLCLPLPAGSAARPREASCSSDADCRSGVCRGQRCRDTCCRDADCPSGAEACLVVGNATACRDAVGGDPVGTPGCGTPPAAPTASCASAVCFSLVATDTGCTDVSECPALRDNYCGDYGAGDPGSTADNDCIYDFCAGSCRTTADCAGAADGNDYLCGKWKGNLPGDLNMCLLRSPGGAAAEGATCTTGGDCASSFCSPAVPRVCRERCATDSDCANPSYPRCAVETHSVLGVSRLVNVCVP